ncbi:MAG: DUF131 domain-containing protein [Candidatus Nezhaarchaeales archaeon]
MGGVMEAGPLVGLLLVITGLILVVISSIKMIRMSGGKCESSGIILIGPVPIIWATSKKLMAVMGIVTAIILFIVSLSWISRLVGG